ncbi:MAG: hypothetical protein QG630_482 [Patescibacteria group bacterium]|nr:hypothetical protein [Patescibacteria group bacterium]
MDIRECENKEYIECLDENLYLLITVPHKQKNTQLIRKKLKGDILEIFDKILLYRSLSELAHQTNKSIPYSHFDTENFNKKRSLDESQKEAEDMFDSYLNSIDKDKFLESISEITYWMAKVEIKEQTEIHKSFLQSWLEWHRHLAKKDKNKREGEKMKEKLRLILGDKIDDFEKINEEHKKNIQRLKDGKENLFVNIDHEIDIEKSIKNTSLLLPERWLGENQDFRIIEEHTKCVVLDNKILSLKEYYEIIKYSIDKDWLKNKDLLKQIITIYLIKRCQNGDEEAYDILFNLYKDGAKHLESKFVKIYNKTEAEGKSLTILSSLLRGNPPSLVYEYLNKNRFEKKYIDLLNKKPYDALNEAYENMFIVINNQFNKLNNELKHLEKNTKDYRNRAKDKKAKLQTKKKYFKKVFTISQNTLSKVSFFSTSFMLFDPIIFLGISPKYNKYLFKPTPTINLTTWLLGDSGMIWKGLSNAFLGRKVNKNESYDENENNYVEDGSGIYIKKKIKNEED